MHPRSRHVARPRPARHDPAAAADHRRLGRPAAVRRRRRHRLAGVRGPARTHRRVRPHPGRQHGHRVRPAADAGRAAGGAGRHPVGPRRHAVRGRGGGGRRPRRRVRRGRLPPGRRPDPRPERDAGGVPVVRADRAAGRRRPGRLRANRGRLRRRHRVRAGPHVRPVRPHLPGGHVPRPARGAAAGRGQALVAGPHGRVGAAAGAKRCPARLQAVHPATTWPSTW